MNSTRHLLTAPFKPGKGSNAERHQDLEATLGKTIEVPEPYLDRISESVMDNPIDVRLVKQATPYFMDEETKKKLNYHPFTMKAFPCTYQIDTALGRRISVLITIEELKIHVDKTERQRQESLPAQLTGKTDQEVNALLAFHCSDIIEALKCPQHDIPKHFFSATPCSKLMTLPVILDGKFRVDFFEFLDKQPIPNATTVWSTTEIEIHEYINLCQNLPLESIEIDYKLLADIDNFLAKTILKPQMQLINKKMAEYDRFIAKIRPAYEKKNFAQILLDEHFPPEKIPESLMLGGTPGAAHTMITTHPVTLDGSSTFEFAVLIKYWETTRWGINPVTGEPLQTIAYDSKLKDDTINFMLNLPLYRQTITPEKAREGDFLRRKETWGYTFGSGMFNRNPIARANSSQPPVPPPQVPALEPLAPAPTHSHEQNTSFAK